MSYNELISLLNYWKNISGEENPEVVVTDEFGSVEIDSVSAAKGIESETAIGIYISE